MERREESTTVPERKSGDRLISDVALVRLELEERACYLICLALQCNRERIAILAASRLPYTMTSLVGVSSTNWTNARIA